jgi:hypothetical protein
MTRTDIAYPSHWSAARRSALNARYAALLDALTANGGGGAYNRTLIRGAVNRGLIVSETDRTPTVFGRAWRAGYTGTPEPVARIAVTSCGAADNGCKRAAPPSKLGRMRTETRALMQRNLIIVDGDALDLGDAPFYLLCMYKMRGQDWKTIEDAAHALRWGIEETRIRAERIEEAGYTLPFNHQDAA